VFLFTLTFWIGCPLMQYEWETVYILYNIRYLFFRQPNHPIIIFAAFSMQLLRKISNVISFKPTPTHTHTSKAICNMRTAPNYFYASSMKFNWDYYKGNCIKYVLISHIDCMLEKYCIFFDNLILLRYQNKISLLFFWIIRYSKHWKTYF